MTTSPRDVMEFQTCIGGCGNDMVPMARFCCADCADRLPESLRSEISRDGTSSPLVARAILWWDNTSSGV